jgi:uncharacterized protein (TIGR03435 family)
MSEGIYALLLRLYPSEFQKAYAEEALQLFRDRSRDERGLVSGLLLWLDLLSDLFISIPRSYQTAPAANAKPCYDGMPLFLILEGEAPSFGSLLYGVIASILVYSVVSVLLNQGGTPFSIHTSNSPQSSSYSGAPAAPLSASAAADDTDAANYADAVGKPTPGVSLSYLPFPAKSGSTVHVTASVQALGARPAPTGTVRFFDGSSVVGEGELSNGTVTLVGKLPILPMHLLRAIYLGDNNYSAVTTLSGERMADLTQAANSTAAKPPAPNYVRPLTFDVVSIHEDKSGDGPQNAWSGATPDGYRLRNGPLLTVIQTAFMPSEGSLTFRPNQITGVPPWAFYQIRYDIDAKVSESDMPSWKDPALQPAMLRTMLQEMLADRFKLTAHRETKVVPIYDLTLGKGSPRLKPYDGATLAKIQQRHPGAHSLAGGPIVVVGPNPGQQWFFGVTLSQLGTLLSNLAGRPVLDKTGLTGRYDVSYQIELRPPPQEDGTPASVPPDFFSSQISTIVEGQLGLRLKAGSGPVESLVIDHVEQPSVN